MMMARGLVLIRTDASRRIGSGHVMRCIALAEALAERGHAVRFVCRPLEGDLRMELRSRGFDVDTLSLIPADNEASDDEVDAEAMVAVIHTLIGPPTWVVVDHYGLGARWHRAVAACGVKILVIDDLADRPLLCDLLVDQNAIDSIHARYPALTPPGCVLLLGPRYTLLRREFRQAHAERIALCGQSAGPGPILVFLGGADADNLTMQILERLEGVTLPGPLQVLVGPMNPWRRELQAWCAEHAVSVVIADREVSRLLVGARAAIVACGMFAVELQALEVPSLLLPLSDIQRTVALRFAEQGRAGVLDPVDLARSGALAAAVQSLLALPAEPGGQCAIPLDGASHIVERMHEIQP